MQLNDLLALVIGKQRKSVIPELMAIAQVMPLYADITEVREEGLPWAGRLRWDDAKGQPQINIDSSLSDNDKLSVLVHEVRHLTGLHTIRLEDADPELRILAQEAIADYNMEYEDLKVRGNKHKNTCDYVACLLNTTADALFQSTCEVIYQLLAQQKANKLSQQNGADKSKEEGNKSEEAKSGGETEEQSREQDNKSQSFSCKHGDRIPQWCLIERNHGVKEELYAWQQMVTAQMKTAGWEPGDVGEYIERSVKAPRLKNLIFNAVFGAGSWPKIKRKTSNRLGTNPSLKGTHSKILLILDTSGSMDTREMSLVLSVVKGLVRQTECWLLDIDVEVHSLRCLKRAHKTILTKGRGGTDFSCLDNAFWVKQLRSFRQWIWVTDGETNGWPTKYMGVNHLILLTDGRTCKVPMRHHRILPVENYQ